MPTASGYYDMYSGKEFNYLWYNINPMEFNGNVDMSIHSSNITLSIGPDENETVYYNNQIKNSNGNPYFPYSFNQTILPTDKLLLTVILKNSQQKVQIKSHKKTVQHHLV